MADQDASLLVLRDFVNTLDRETGKDEIAAGADLVSWLARHGLAPANLRAARADVERATALREALRGHLLANGGEELQTEHVAALDRQAARSRVVLAFDAGGAALRPSVTGVDGALGGLLALAAGAMADGSWSRLKACGADSCRWAFVDTSRNGSRRWCAMRICGNREKVRAYRARHSAASGPD